MVKKEKKASKLTSKKGGIKSSRVKLKKTAAKKILNKKAVKKKAVKKSVGKVASKPAKKTTPKAKDPKDALRWIDEFTSSLPSEGMFLLHDGKIIDVAGSGLRMLGLKNISEAKKHHLADFIDPKKLPIASSVLSGKSTTGFETLIEFISHDKRKFTASVCSTPLIDGDQNILVVRARDASREIAWRRDAMMTSAMYRHLFNTSQAMNCVLDGEGYILLANEAGSKMLGHDTSSALAGKPFYTIVHPEYQDVFKLSLKNLIDSDNVAHAKFVKADASIIDVEVLAHDIGDGQTMIEARDVTERVRTAQALRDREGRLQGILNTVADAIVTINEKGIIIAFNNAAEMIFGYKAEEAMGQNISVLIGAKHSSHHDKYMGRYKNENKSTII
ncbi:MAG: PAS domain S-box protein, partial [Rhodospirillaceae bacterium]|nr:PAS domain S-box protein [Rhodospirillaceae bacterium]